jgi:hypothetical protein
MIDVLERVARRFRPLRHVAVVLGVGCLAALAYILFLAPPTSDSNRYLVPALVGFIWCLSAWGFIDTFQSVPGRAGRKQGLFTRLKRSAARAWFWFLALVFGASTLAALFLTFKLGVFWLGR